MEINKYLKRLAKSTYAQNLFLAAKDIGTIRLFENSIDFSGLQQAYLAYLYTYNDIYQDIYSKEVSPKVLDDEIYTDAYLYYKHNKKDKKDNQYKKDKKIQAVFAKDNNKIIFPKKEAK